MRISLRATTLLVAAAATLSCTDAPTGPGGSGGEHRAGRLALAPGFSPTAQRAYLALAQIGVDIASVRVRLVNAAGVLVLDTTVDFPADKDTLNLPLDVPIDGIEQTFTATIELRDASGVVLFSSTQTVTARDVRLPTVIPPVITLEFVGPGAAATAVSVSPATGSVASNATQTLTASATNASGAPVTNLLVVWTSSDTTIALILPTTNTTAAVQQTGRRGTATFTARTLGGVSGTATLTFLPKPARLVTVSGSAQTAAAGHELSQPFVVQLLGVDSLPVAGQPVTFRAVTAGGSVGTATATTGDDGKATTTLTVGRTPGAYQFEAVLGSITASVQATAATGPASQFVVSQPLPAQLSVGAAAPLPFRATLADEFGNVVRSAGTVLSAAVSVSPGGQTFSASATTDTSGSVTLPLPVYLGPPGTATVVLSSPAFGTISTTIIPVVVGPPATLKIVQQPAASAASGAPLSTAPAVQLVDVAGNPTAATAVVTVSLNGGGGATLGGTTTVTTASDGSAAFAGLSIAGPVGSYSLSFTTTGLPPATSNAIALGVGAAAQLVVQPGYSASASAGSVVPVPPTVIVRDASGNPVAGVSVSFAILAGGGSIASSSVVTNASGLATVDTWRLGSGAGQNTLRITVPSIPALSGTPADVSVTGLAGTPTQFGALSGSGPGVTGGTTQVRVKVADASGNPVSGRTVTFTAGGGSGSVAPATVVSDATGQAAATWTRGYVVGVQTVTATPDFPAAALAFTSTVSPDVNSQIKVVAEPLSATNGVVLSPQPQVQLFDASGTNPIAQAGVNVTASIALGSGTLQGPQSVVTDATGRATFSGLSIVGTIGSYRLGFAASGYVSGASGTFPLAAGAPALVTLLPGHSTSAAAGTLPPAPPTFNVADASGNPVPGVNVTFAVTAGGGSITTPNVVTNASGVATADSWRLGPTVGMNTLRATVASLTPVQVSVQGVAGAAAKLDWIIQPPDTVFVGAPISTSPRVRLLDALGNVVRTSNVNVRQRGIGGPGVRIDSVLTDANGEATLAISAYTGTAGTLRYSVTSDGLDSLVKNIVARAGAPAAAKLVQAPAVGQKSGDVLTPFPIIQLVDAGDNPVSGSYAVTVSVGGQIATLSGAQTHPLDGAGRATFNDLVLTGPVGSYTLTFVTGTGQFTPVTASIALAAGRPTQLEIIPEGDRQSAPSGTNVPIKPQVRVMDAARNPVQGVPVLFTAENGSQVDAGKGLGPTAEVGTDAAGIATLSVWRLGISGNNVLRASASGVGGEVQFTATDVPPRVTKFVVISGDRQEGPLGTQLKDSVVVEAQDESGRPVPYAAVLVETNGCCSGSVAIIGGMHAGYRDSSRTDAEGRVRFRWTMPGNPDGPISAHIFNYDDFAGVQVTATIQTNGVLHLETINDGNYDGVVGEKLRFRHVSIHDARGDIARIAEHITVTLVPVEAPDGGEFASGSTTMQQTSAGETDFVNMIVTKPGLFKLRFTAPGIVPVETSDFYVSSGVQ